MKCSNCNAENQEGSKFCSTCGKPIERACLSCGYENPPGTKFCGMCATPLGEAPKPPPPRPEVEAIKTFEGQLKLVSVLFADVKGSTALAIERDPEETRQLIEPALQLMMEAVHKYGGTVTKSTGDGVMALFGAPIAYEDHAIRSCYAGLAMQKKMKEKNSGVSIRVGINSGEVVVDTIGTDIGKEYDATGSAVNLSARMEQLAEPGMVQITPSTLSLVKGDVKVKSRGEMEVKGLPEPLEVFELVGIVQELSGFEQKRPAQLSDFVNRKKEMHLLEYNIEQVLKGHGNCCAVMGEPGVGKSRLAYEFIIAPKVQNVTHYESHCISINSNSPLFPIKQLLKRFLGISDEPPEEQIKMIDQKLETINQDVALIRNSCLSLLDLPNDDSEWNTFSPEFKRQRIMDGFTALFINASELEPFIALIENIQWIDRESIECLDKLIEVLPDKKIFLLLTFRPEFEHKWTKEQHFSLIKINPLLVEDFRLLATNILGPDASIKNLKPQLIERCNGNPFFLEETIRSLRDRHVLDGDYGNYRLTTPSESLVLPRNVQSVLEARVDRLSYKEKSVLQISSVIGHLIPRQLLDLLLPLSDEELNNVLESLYDKNFIYKTQEYPKVIFSFTQSITQDAVYMNQLRSRRKQMHLEVLQCLENNFPSEENEQLEIRANHAYKGESWEKALNYFFLLGDKAFEQSAALEGIEQYRKATLSFLNIASPSIEQCRQAVKCSLRKSHLAIWVARFNETIDGIKDALEISNNFLKDRVIESQLKAWLGTCYCGIGEYQSGVVVCREATKLAEENKSDEELYRKLLTHISFSLFHVFFYLGDYKKTIENTQKVLKYEKDPFARDPITGTPFWSVSMLYRLMACGILGDFKCARKIRQEIFDAIKDSPPSLEVILGQNIIGISLCEQGEMDQALAQLDLSLEEATKTKVYVLMCPALAAKGFILSLQNKVEEAALCLEKSFKMATEMNFAFKTSWSLNYLCEGYLNLYKLEQAKVITEKMFELDEKRNQKGIEVYAWHFKAELERVKGVTNPEQTYKKAIQLAEERGMLTQVAHSYRGLFQFYVKTNQSEKGETAFQAANALYQEMGMKYWHQKMEEIKTKTS